MGGVVTFGCRLNAWEADAIRGHLKRAGDDDTIVVNTCAVTAEAERQGRQAARRARRERPGAIVVATGCAVEIDPDAWAAMPEVDRTVGNAAKIRPETWSAPPRGTAPSAPERFAGRARAFARVQTGCDHRCTFCVIPHGRGVSRSTPAGEVAREVAELVEAGCREIVLTGVDITAWGDDLPGRPRLGDLVRHVLRLTPDLPRLRLTSLDVAEVDDALLRALAEEERLMPHLHLSLQAGDAMTLKRMKRRHAPERAVAFCDTVRRLRPDTVFGADLIAGFPTETDAMFENTLRHVADCGLTWLHVFPYSERPGVPAARMPQVDKAVRVERAARLRAAGDEAARSFLAGRVGRTERVLVEARGRGRSEHFAPVATPSSLAPGGIASLAIAASDGTGLLAETAR